MTTFHPLPLTSYPFSRSSSRGCSRPSSRPASPALLPSRSRDAPPLEATTPAHAAFRLHDLAPELQLAIFSYVADLDATSLAAAARVNSEWHEALTPWLYRSLAVGKANREAVFVGLGLDYLSASDIESRAEEAEVISTPLAERKLASLRNVKHLTISDTPGALAVAEAIIAHENLFGSVETLTLAAPVFRHLVNSGLAAFGRPRSGSAFVGETLVARLRPKHLHIHYPAPRSGAGVFDPVLLARVMAVLMVEWHPETVDYHGVASDYPPVLGARTRIHCGPCVQSSQWDEDSACTAHALVRMHLRRIYGPHARDELLEAIAEGADPTDDDDLDADDVPDSLNAVVEYYNVPCIVAADRETFLDQTFGNWPTDADVANQVKFFA